MRKNTYSKILMAPLFMLLAVACSPNQFNQSTEYDDVYFTSSDRSTATPGKERANRSAPLQSQEKTAVLESYSPTQVNENIVSKYNNGTDNTVTYYEPGPLVTTATELNYDDFVADYNNEQLAYYELPLDWSTDWNRISFNRLVQDDFQFRLAWYDQYYRGQSFRMSQYLAGNFGSAGRRGMFGSPRVGLSVGFSNVFLGYNNMAFVDLNPWGIYDPFWQPAGFRVGIGWNSWRWNRRWNNWGWGWNDPFYCPPIGNAWAGGWGWRGGWNNNVFVNNNIFIDRRADRILASNRNVQRGPRVSTSRISTVRNEVINGTAPTTRSTRYADNLNGQRSSAVNSRSGRANSGRATTTNSVVSRSGRAAVSNGRTAQTRTSAYRFEDGGRSSRSSYVRNNGSANRSSTSRSTRAARPSDGSSRSSYSTSRNSRSQSSPSFNRNSSSRSYSTNRSSRSNDSGVRSRGSSSSRSGYSRGSSSRSSYSNGRSSSSGSRGSYSRGSSSRSSGSASRGSSRSSSRSSGSVSRGSSRSSSSRSSGSISRGSSSRSSGSRSSSSSSRSSSRSSSSSRSGRGN